MDGVLCDFNEALVRFIRENLNPSIPDVSESFPSDWNYFRAYLKPGEEEYMWEQVHLASRGFWRALKPFTGVQRPLFRLSRGTDDLYFITTRHGKTAKRQSEMWLTDHGRVPFPTVLIADDPTAKGRLCAALNLDYFVDDRPENCLAVKDEGGRARVFLVDRPYNRAGDTGGAERVASFEEFVERIEESERGA